MLKRCLTILKLALPVMVSQVSLILVAFADNIMVGRYSTGALAASSFVINVFNLVIFCAMGFSYGLTPIVGAMSARGEKRQIGTAVRAALRANIIVALVLSALMGILFFFVEDLGQPQELMPILKPYYLIFLAGLVPLAVFNVFAQWSFGIRNTSMPMWILLGANLLNIIGNYMLIYGNWGAPELGLTGAGLSTLAARVIAALAIMGVFFMRRTSEEYRRGFKEAQPQRLHELSGTVVRTSWPVAAQMTFETGAFSSCAIFAGWLGTISLAAFQVTVVVSTLGFCIYYSIGTAIAVTVANDAGTGALHTCRRSAFDGYIVMLVFAALSSTVLAVFGRRLMQLFSEDPYVLALAGTVIFPLVLYQLGDATQIAFSNALRGTSKVMPMVWIAFVSYMVAGLPSTYLLSFTAGLGVYGIVLSFSVSLFLAAALFLYFFLRATRHRPVAGAEMTIIRQTT